MLARAKRPPLPPNFVPRKRIRPPQWYLGRVILYGVILLLATVCLIPLYWMFRSSFMKNLDIMVLDPFVFWPAEMRFDNYVKAYETAPFLQFGINTLVIIAGNLLGTILTSTMAAYAFSRINWTGKRFCFTLILSTMMLPGTVTLIPQFLIFSKLHMIDTYYPLILPSFFGGGAFNIFLLRQFFLTIPKELDYAAQIDGAGPFRVYVSIILPLAKSAIVVVALFTFMGCWNDYFSPIIYLNTTKKFTLAVGLLWFRGQYTTKWNLMMAGSTIVAVPCILIYLLGQKYLIEGISMSGMKA